jgi:orotidine 5'-phosphate decarboxylase subfamily 2
MSAYLELLADSYGRKNTLLCFGMDPVIERMKIDLSKNLSDEIVRYFSTILSAVSPRISAVKPNIGFYLQYGKQGMGALHRLATEAKEMKLPVIADLKAGDIGRTSAAYARFVFEEVGADAVTLNPYMGYDAIEPFAQYGEKGFYILALTSNPGSRDFQLLMTKQSEPLFAQVLRNICAWSEKKSAIGAVVGATQSDFETCIGIIQASGRSIPLLIPGVGAQGGDYGEIQALLVEHGYTLSHARINASSSISYAHERYSSKDFDEAAVLAVEELTGSRSAF